MEIKEIRQYLLGKYDCIKDVRVNELLNTDTLERIGNRVTATLETKAMYSGKWIEGIRLEIGAKEGFVTSVRNRLTLIYNFYEDKPKSDA